MGQVCFSAISSNRACHHGLHCSLFSVPSRVQCVFFDCSSAGVRVHGGVGGLAGAPPPPIVPQGAAEGGPKIFNLKSSWRRSKILAVILKHWKGRRGEGGV